MALLAVTRRILGWLLGSPRPKSPTCIEIDRAERAFSEVHPGRELIGNMSRVHHRGEGFCVVQLCYAWGGIPPRRSWWYVTPGARCRELSLDEVNAAAPVAPWR